MPLCGKRARRAIQYHRRWRRTLDGPHVDPSMKAVLLAKGISLLMNMTAAALLVQLLLFAA